MHLINISSHSAYRSVCHESNSNLAVLRLLAKEGSGADIVSGGELFRINAVKNSTHVDRICRSRQIQGRNSIRAGIGYLMFNVESPGELQQINEVAGAMGLPARVALRINPDIDPQTHPYISTGLKKSKFGIGGGPGSGRV